jgi:hypothetical protein
MKEVDDVIISSIHRITGNEYFKQLFLRQSQNCFSARSAKVPSTQKSRLWDFLLKMGRFSPLQPLPTGPSRTNFAGQPITNRKRFGRHY